jgi:hypothetical protein
MAEKKISQLTAKGAAIAATDLLVISEDAGGGSYTTKSVTGANILSPRVQSVTSSATVTATSANDLVKITAQAAGLTLANPTGTFVEGQALIFRIKDNGTARSIGFGAKFRAIGVTLPTTTTISKTTYVGCIYNSTDDKFDVIASLTEA